MVLTPKGKGAFIVGPAPDSTPIGGYGRGDNSIDIQTVRNNADQIAYGDRNVCIGNNCRAGGNDGITIGLSSTSNGGMAIGNAADCQYGFDAIAIGRSVISRATNSISIGTQCDSSGSRAIALGFGALSQATDVIAIGTSSLARNYSATAVGDRSDAVGAKSVAIGQLSVGEADSSIAIGTEAVAHADDSIAIGRLAATLENDAIAIGTQAGAEGGSVSIGRAASCGGVNSVSIGNGSRAVIEGIAIGKTALANGTESIAIGNQAGATNTDSIAIGGMTTASAALGIAIGKSASGLGSSSVALGTGSNTFKPNSVAIGPGASVSGQWSDWGTAIGYNARVTAYYATAIGHGAFANRKGQVTFGHKTQGKRTSQMTLSRTTTMAVLDRMVLDGEIYVIPSGDVAIERYSEIKLEPNTIMLASIFALGTSAGKVLVMRRHVMARANSAGVVSLIAPIETIGTDVRDPGTEAWQLYIECPAGTNGLDPVISIRVKGENGVTIGWVARVDATEIVSPQ